jgi:hypothetical protein
MSVGFPAASKPEAAISPRRPNPEEVAAIAREVAQWAGTTPNVKSASLYTHRERPTVRCAIVPLSRAYDPALVDAVSALDLKFAQRPDLSGIDFEVRLFFAAPEQVVAWARGWEPWSDA